MPKGYFVEVIENYGTPEMIVKAKHGHDGWAPFAPAMDLVEAYLLAASLEQEFDPMKGNLFLRPIEEAAFVSGVNVDRDRQVPENLEVYLREDQFGL